MTSDAERMAVLETKVQNLSDQLHDTHKKVEEMHEVLLQARGARWAILGMAAVGGAIASMATKLLPITWSLPR